jgi:hypothetical protein
VGGDGIGIGPDRPRHGRGRNGVWGLDGLCAKMAVSWVSRDGHRSRGGGPLDSARPLEICWCASVRRSQTARRDTVSGSGKQGRRRHGWAGRQAPTTGAAGAHRRPPPAQQIEQPRRGSSDGRVCERERIYQCASPVYVQKRPNMALASANVLRQLSSGRG